MLLRTSLLAAATVVTMASAALADPASEGFRVSREELAAMVAKTTDGTAFGTLPVAAGATVLLARRDKSGDVEVHKNQHDVFMVQSGKATVLLGPDVEGAKETGPGELRGGTIKNPRRVDLSAGDVMWIPAGQGHQTTVAPGGSFVYLVVKLNAAPAK